MVGAWLVHGWCMVSAWWEHSGCMVGASAGWVNYAEQVPQSCPDCCMHAWRQPKGTVS